MKFIQGHNRNQINLFPVSLDQSIDPDNEVRIIDLFIAKHFDLIGGKLIAGDSTKLRAQNSKKNNFNQAKPANHVRRD